MDGNELQENELKRKIGVAFEEIRCFINELPSHLSKEIWEELWGACAIGKIEDDWSEYHFYQHLSALSDIINDVLYENIKLDMSKKEFFEFQVGYFNRSLTQIRSMHQELSDLLLNV